MEVSDDSFILILEKKYIGESFSDEWKEMMGREFESILFPEFETANSELLDTYRYVHCSSSSLVLKARILKVISLDNPLVLICSF